MTSEATSSYLENRLTASFNNGLRQLLLLQGKSGSNLLFQGQQEHRGGNDAQRVFQEGPCNSLARSLSYSEGHTVFASPPCFKAAGFSRTRSAQRCFSVLSPEVTDFELHRCAENSCCMTNLHYTTRFKLWLNATMISIPRHSQVVTNALHPASNLFRIPIS